MRSNKVETGHKPTDTDYLALDTLKWIYEAYVDKWCHGMRWEGNAVSGGGLGVHINDEVLLWADDERWRHSPSKCHYAAKPGLNTGHAGILVTIRGVLTLPGWLYPIQLFAICLSPDCGTGSDKRPIYCYLATLQSECQDGAVSVSMISAPACLHCPGSNVSEHLSQHWNIAGNIW